MVWEKKGGIGLGLGLGFGIGASSSSRKVLLQLGQIRSEVEDEMKAVRSHWWQKYWRSSSEFPPGGRLWLPPAEDMSA